MGFALSMMKLLFPGAKPVWPALKSADELDVDVSYLEGEEDLLVLRPQFYCHKRSNTFGENANQKMASVGFDFFLNNHHTNNSITKRTKIPRQGSPTAFLTNVACFRRPAFR